MKSIYIATNVHGYGVKAVAEFDGKPDLIRYADSVTAMHDIRINNSDSIATICEKLYDLGPGYGARHHDRVSRTEARKLIRNPAVADDTWLVRG